MQYSGKTKKAKKAKKDIYDLENQLSVNKQIIDNINISIEQACIAIIFSFYALVLLDSYGDSPTLEDLCTIIFRLEKNSESYVKIQSIFYGIAFSDHPLFIEIRGRMLYPHRYDTFLIEYKL